MSPADFNDQLFCWLQVANARFHSTIRCRPVDRFEEDRAQMMALPPLLPDPSLRLSTRLGRDHWVRVGTCDYSVHPKAIGHKVDIRADLSHVEVRWAGELVASHRRCWGRHLVITDPAHEAAGATMRAEHRHLARQLSDEGVEVRDLSVYDQVTGVA